MFLSAAAEQIKMFKLNGLNALEPSKLVDQRRFELFEHLLTKKTPFKSLTERLLEKAMQFLIFYGSHPNLYPTFATDYFRNN